MSWRRRPRSNAIISAAAILDRPRDEILDALAVFPQRLDHEPVKGVARRIPVEAAAAAVGDREYDALPRSLSSIEEIERAQAFAKEAYALLNEAKRARLDDGRPFSEATKTVKAFFDRVEGPIKAIMAELSGRVTEAVIRQQQLLAAQKMDEIEEEPEEVIEAAIVDIRTGRPVVAVVEVSATEMPKLEWTIEGFDRARIDLESLRPFFTDSAILLACRKHMESHGPNKLRGASYGQIAVTR